MSYAIMHLLVQGTTGMDALARLLLKQGVGIFCMQCARCAAEAFRSKETEFTVGPGQREPFTASKFRARNGCWKSGVVSSLHVRILQCDNAAVAQDQSQMVPSDS